MANIEQIESLFPVGVSLHIQSNHRGNVVKACYKDKHAAWAFDKDQRLDLVDWKPYVNFIRGLMKRNGHIDG